MAIKYDERVNDLFKKAAEIAKKNGQKNFGTPHVMRAIMDTNDFKSAYDGNDYDELEKFVDYHVSIYNDPTATEEVGTDLAFAEHALPLIYKKTKEGLNPEKIIIAHMFLAVCGESNYFHLESYFESHGIFKMDIFMDIATYADVDNEEAHTEKLEDFSLIYDINNKSGKIVKKKAVDPMEGTPEMSESPYAHPGFGRSRSTGKEFEKYCTDLVEKAKSYTKPFIGREDVIERTLQVLCKSEKANPVHVGEPGVGKSAVTLGLAKKISEGDVPDTLKNSKLYELDITALLAGTCYRGDFEQRIKMVLDTLRKMDKSILFIDEIHMLIGAGASGSGAMDAANILKPYLTEGTIKFIGATTYSEYANYIEKDPALMRRFQRIDIKEPTVDDAIKIIDGLKKKYEEYHKITYTEDAIKASVELTAKHIHDRYLPDKAVDMIDEAGAYMNIHPELGTVVGEALIADVTCSVCNIPKKTLDNDDLTLVADLDTSLKAKVFGQDEAIELVTSHIQMSKSGLGDEDKPIGSFLFVGPSGVGKTELAKTMAETMNMKLIRFDMSEYASEVSATKIIGSSAGYVGYDEGGLLTNAIIKNPYSVVLLDEIEKAHPNIFKTFLQMLDYGMLTDNHGRKVDCRNTIIIMTSNAGVEESTKPNFGFVREEATVNTAAITDAVNSLFPAEFRNRLSGIVKFNGLTNSIAKLIARRELDILTEKLKKQCVEVFFTDACMERIAELGTSPEYGARELKRVVDQNIKTMFVHNILKKTAPKKCSVDYNGSFEIIPVAETVVKEAIS